MRLLKIIIILLLASIVLAQEPEQSKPIIQYGDKNYVMDIAPEDRLSKKILFVFDKSGSMDSRKFAEALTVVDFILSQAVDGYEISLIAFDGELYRWPGIPEPDKNPPIPPNWASMPSGHARNLALKYLEDLGHKGNTFVGKALIEALKESRNDLTIVLVTDGLFQQENINVICNSIRQAQRERVKNGLEPAGIMCLGVNQWPSSTLRRIAEIGKMGYLYPARNRD